jgi:hypothetical protein
MANDGAGSIHVVAMRVSQLDVTGKPATGLNSYVTNQLMRIDLNPDIEAGPEISDRNAGGALAVTYKQMDVYKRLVTTVELMVPDPVLEVMMTGGSTFVSGGGTNVMGMQYPAVMAEAVPNGVGIEAWTRRIINGQQDTVFPWMRWIFPKVKLRKSNRTGDINRMANPFEGFIFENPNFGTGPVKDIPFDTSKVAQWYQDATIPTASLAAIPIT